MTTTALVTQFVASPSVQGAIAALRAGDTPYLGSLPGCAVALAVLSAAKASNSPLLILLPSARHVENLQEDLAQFTSLPVSVFPPDETRVDDMESGASLTVASQHTPGLAGASSLARRWEVLQDFLSPCDRPPPQAVYLSTVAAILQGVPARDKRALHSFHLKKGDEVPIDYITDWLDTRGFLRVPMVENPGEFSLRGGILDIFYNHARDPLRIEFFGDRIESLREFSTATQLSVLEITEAVVVSLQSAGQGDPASERECLLDHLPAGCQVIFVERQLSEEQLKNSVHTLDFPYDKILATLQQQPVLHLSTLPYSPGTSHYNLDVRSVERFVGGTERLCEGLSQLPAQEIITFFCMNDAEIERLRKLLPRHSADPARIQFFTGQISGGFRNLESGSTVLSSREVFQRYRSAHKVKKYKSAVALDSFFDLQEGDYVVHMNHGIGRFLGMETKTNGPIAREFFVLEYAEGSKVYVPVTNIELIQKYVGGGEGVEIELDTLGSSQWKKRRAKVKSALREMAGELLQLQARRLQTPGIAYPTVDAAEEEFNESFPYEDTPDQEEVTRQLQNDMQLSRPMDRLICGEVGFGKTELAVRAAFKAVNFGKQVAVLVPTTILAQQHFRTFSERMKEYPVTVGCLSRFQSKKEQAETVARAELGEIDIVIGTHRILSNDVKFKDLGLLIIDEEQRFGVKHKEKLKRLRSNVDVLTLTATPIPRTLHQAMVGIKDISTLSTPPADRQSVQTKVTRDDDELIRRACLRELERGGQIFFLHNRIFNIEEIAGRLARLVPQARVGIAHGQMDSDILEDRMAEFIDGNFDLLVSTNIIESGLDIPRANTLFVNHADTFGLADLHQLRGRVGRHKHKAYAYFLIERGKYVPDIAMRRLRAIEEFNELGAGFKIAMRDLEIRGAGNLLGAEQHGHIKAVGYDLYCKLLNQTMEEMKGRELPVEAEDFQLDVRIDVQIPASYIPDTAQRIEAYRKISRSVQDNSRNKIETELRDRYGALPTDVILMMDLQAVRYHAMRHSIRRIYMENDALIFEPTNMQLALPAFAKIRDRIRIYDNRKILCFPTGKEASPEGLAALLKKILDS